MKRHRRQVRPEGVPTGGQLFGELTALVDQADLALRHDESLEGTMRARVIQDEIQLRVLEPDAFAVDDLDPHILKTGPQRIPSRHQDSLESTVDPDQSSLSISHVEHFGLLAQDIRTDQEVEVVVVDPRIPHRQDINTILHLRIEDPVLARAEDLDDLTCLEVNPSLKASQPNSLDRVHSSILPLL